MHSQLGTLLTDSLSSRDQIAKEWNEINMLDQYIPSPEKLIELCKRNIVSNEFLATLCMANDFLYPSSS